MSLVRSELDLQTLAKKLRKARGGRMVVMEYRPDELVEYGLDCRPDDLTNFAVVLLDLAGRHDVAGESDECAVCLARRERAATALAVLTAPLDANHQH